ncbi:hypothetical protein KP509_25G036900 [Ceratopteris richardii]|uniref:Uncharacterized protein n=1 Tax=Ceratopteris richardii TaxID=49495 RepID=A0A8T2RRP4_CERRI|nr:hypothetical protein KP509_25G036900 [Ceratopteris richardii]
MSLRVYIYVHSVFTSYIGYESLSHTHREDIRKHFWQKTSRVLTRFLGIVFCVIIFQCSSSYSLIFVCMIFWSVLFEEDHIDMRYGIKSAPHRSMKSLCFVFLLQRRSCFLKDFLTYFHEISNLLLLNTICGIKEFS